MPCSSGAKKVLPLPGLQILRPFLNLFQENSDSSAFAIEDRETSSLDIGTKSKRSPPVATACQIMLVFLSLGDIIHTSLLVRGTLRFPLVPGGIFTPWEPSFTFVKRSLVSVGV